MNDIPLNIDQSETVTIPEAATILGAGATPEHVRGCILRGTLKAHKDEKGEWCIFLSTLRAILEELEPCDNCNRPATIKIIVKYHFHERVEFTLCDKCASATESSYSRRGGVLEVVRYSLLSEGWVDEYWS